MDSDEHQPGTDASGAITLGRCGGRRSRGRRKPDLSLWRIAREVYVAETTEQARNDMLGGTLARGYRDYFLRLIPKSHLMHLMKQDPYMADSDVTINYLNRQRVCRWQP